MCDGLCFARAKIGASPRPAVPKGHISVIRPRCGSQLARIPVEMLSAMG